MDNLLFGYMGVGLGHMDPAAILEMRETCIWKKILSRLDIVPRVFLSPSVFLLIFGGSSSPVSLAVDLGLQKCIQFWQSVPDAGRTTTE